MPRLPLLCLAVVAAAACESSGGSGPPPIDMPVTDGAGSGMPLDTTSTGDTEGTTAATEAADSTAASDSTTGEPTNCEDITCTGHGSCQIDPRLGAFCACDPGYVLDERGEACVVDEACVKVRFLEDHCRQLVNGPPAVSLFFALDFCAGTAVTQEKFEELGLGFVVLENGIDILQNVESESTIVPTSVESYVTLVVDVSDSVTQSNDLSALVVELRALVQSLVPTAGEPDVYLSVYVFGRFVEEYVPFTRDFAAVDTALAQIETDPASVVALVNGDGTSLYEAVTVGINRTQRIRDMRDAVSWGGVLSTGTVVVVTDGQDTSNGDLDANLVNDTVNQVISIGISPDISDADLDTIGRDGSFLAPEPALWTAAFEEVSQRVDEYPDRAYLLAYCSSTTNGEPNVEVSLTARTKLVVEQSAVCQFNADVFSSDPGATCNADLFANECVAADCGGLTACGSCADDECCNGSQCMAPISADAIPLECQDYDWLCSATAEVCDDVTALCEPPSSVGSACGSGCYPTEAWCDETDMCVAALPEGSLCETATQCVSLNCQQTNPDNPFEPRTCQSPALTHDRCEGSDRVRCEEGAFCSGSRCAPRQLNATTCSAGEQCRSALCANPVMQSVCWATGACFWAWNEKVPD